MDLKPGDVILKSGGHPLSVVVNATMSRVTVAMKATRETLPLPY
jgi:hypothetical protein